MGEFELIDLIKKTLGETGARVRLGIGDDAAVCESPRYPLLFCSDAMVENTHFRLNWTTPEDLGHKALASVLSDIAAMNGRPLYALVSLALRPGLGAEFVEAFYRGLGKLAKRFDVSIVGGDLVSASHEVFIDISVVGESEAPATRAGARPGDLLAVSGSIGSSQAALFALQKGIPAHAIDPNLLSAHFRPFPRFDVIDAIKSLQTPDLVTAMIDISDGLSSEIHHLARRSSCGFLVDEAAIPIHPTANALAREYKQNSLDWAWGGGEDYQLLMTLDPAKWAELLVSHPETPNWLTLIGKAVPASQGVLKTSAATGQKETLSPSGWTHR